MELLEYIKVISEPGEIWKRIAGYPQYLVSSLGRIISTKSDNARLLRPCTIKDRGRAYSYVCLTNVKSSKVRIHRLVAEAFLDNPNGYKEIDHINNIGTDNRSCNLRWCTHKENMNNPHTIESLREYKRQHPYMPDLTIFINKHEQERKRVGAFLKGVCMKQYESLKATEEDGFVKCSVSAACHNRLKTYKGYTWRFLD